MKLENPEQEHSCSCCENPEIVEQLIGLSSKTTPPVLCDGVVKIAESRGNYSLGNLQRAANSANGILTEAEKAERQEKLVQRVRKQLLGDTSSCRG
jgi:hypothetical protein